MVALHNLKMNKGLEKGERQQTGEFKKGKTVVLIYIRPGSWNPHLSQLLNTGLPKLFPEWTQ